MHKNFFISISTFLFLFFLVPTAFAHVSVKPDHVGVASFQIFTVGVPSEKEVSTTQVRLLIPEGVNYVTPNVKPGWNVDLKKTGEEEEAKVTEIIWTGGEIPTGQRDEFSFSAQAPGKVTTIPWKAYQTYADGEEIAWDTNPKDIKEDKEAAEGDEDEETTHPYAETKVINDLAGASQAKTKNEGTTVNQAMTIAYIALALAAVALGMQLRKNN